MRMKKIIEKIKKSGFLLLALAVCMTGTARTEVFAAKAAGASAALEYTRKGSVTVDVVSTDTGKAISGGTITLYQVATATQKSGENGYVLTGEFKESGISLAGISESAAGMQELASGLEGYVDEHTVTGTTATVDQSGQARWTDLELGLYLVVHTAPATGYAPVHSFLITVPRYLDGTYLYDVDAKPKTGTADTAVQKPSGLSPSAAKASLTGGKLPQTGQLWWPVPVLAFAGVLLVMAGWYRRRCFGKYSGKC